MAIQISPAVAPSSPSRPAAASAPVPFHVAAGLLRGLNREQRIAVKHGDGPLLVVAGPGTGKTEVVTRRLAWLIATKRARAREILALTFTDNAAQEMQARVDVLVPYGQADTAVHTFHAFGDRLLREYAFELGLPGDVRLINRAEAIVLLTEHLFELGLETYRPLGDPTRFLGALVDLFQRAKDQDVSPEAMIRYAQHLPQRDDAETGVARTRQELARAFAAYQSLLARNGLIDYGDQVSLAVQLLRDRPELREGVISRYRYLLVDEFQDLNPAQVQLVHLLTGHTRNVTMVGDPDQAIYNFRGAAANNMDSFAESHPDLRQVVLRRNYRSRQAIIDGAQRLVSHSDVATDVRERQVSNRRSRGTNAIRSSWYATPDDETEGVAMAVAGALADGVRPREIAVLARSNAEIEPLARALRMRAIPVRTQLRSDFFAQPEVRPLLAYLRVVVDPQHTLELYTLATGFPYGLGGEHLTDLLSRARRRHQSLWQSLTDAETQADLPAAFSAGVARLTADVRAGMTLGPERTSTEVLYDYVRRSGRLARLAASADPSGARSVARFFEIVRSRARLLTQDRVAFLVPHMDTLIEADDEPADTGPLDLDAVSVLTVHRAKGLEFGIVHLTGLVDGRFPARGRPPTLDMPWDEIAGRPVNESDRLDEERRLCFVAMTRARDELWLSYHVLGPGGRGRRRPSPFVGEALDTPPAASVIELDAIARIETLGQPESSEAAAPVAAGPRGVFSFSELETYLDCPERYRLRHVVGLPSSPHHALTYGSAMHQAVAAFHLSRGKGAPLSEEQLLDVFARAWSPEGFLSREHEERRYAAGQAALRSFRDTQLGQPTFVTAVERPFAFQMEGLTVRGRIDRLDATPEGAVITDYKSSDVRDQAKADQKARDSLQLQVYALAHESEHGSLPHEVRLHFLDSGVVGRATPDPVRLEKARTKLKVAAARIGEGDFPPQPSAITCGYCPYRQICSASAA